LNFKSGRADANRQDRNGNSPLHRLVNVFQKNPIEAAKIGQLLLEAGAEPNLFNEQGFTPLHLAIRKGQKAAVEFFLNYNSVQKSQCFSLKLATSSLSSPMHLAALSESVPLIMLVYRIYPLQLFAYNNKDQRPVDIIQKNYTLSKIFQAMETTFLKKAILSQIKLAPPPATTVQPQPRQPLSEVPRGGSR
jgi:ankyrin repeat protein